MGEKEGKSKEIEDIFIEVRRHNTFNINQVEFRGKVIVKVNGKRDVEYNFGKNVCMDEFKCVFDCVWEDLGRLVRRSIEETAGVEFD